MMRSYDAFISYGRADSKGFATDLNQRLTDLGLEVWFDFEDIPLGVDYQNQIDDGIEHSHNFLFLISPHSVNSPYCRKEIELAIALGKRIIPLLHVEKITRETWQQRFPQGTDEEWDTYVAQGLHESYANMHPVIQKINWVYCREEQDDFEGALTALQGIFERQREYVQQHTWFLSKALHWQRQEQLPRLLLTGEELVIAEHWLLTQFTEAQPPCLPIDVQCEYISESLKNKHNLLTDVFLSYAEEDRDLMTHLKAYLWRAGLTVWTNKTDIQSGEDFYQAIKRGIEGASNVVYLLSPEAIASTYCQEELNHAFNLHKRIIPMLVRPVDPGLVPPPLRDLQYIDLLGDGQQGTSDEHKRSQLLKILRQDAAYYDTHKQLLVRALKWERQHHNPSILLRGHNLSQGESWLQLAQERSHHPPIPLQVTFLEESLRQPPATALDVFISYSRTDAGIARQINDALQMQGKTTWFDQESIAAGSADFQQEIYRGIEVSDNFVFILSPSSITSPYCDDEVEYAAKLNKRIITILALPVDPAQLCPALAKVQWLDFTSAQGNFSAAFSQFIRTLDTDREHVHSHTRWSQRSLEWDAKNRTEDLLLRGTELAIAQNWLQEAEHQAKRPLPTELQKQFILTSQALSDRLQQEAEARRQRELAQAQELAEAAEAQRRAEAEARRQAEQRAEQEARARRVSQRITLLTAIGAPLLSVLVLAMGVTWRASQVDEIETLTIEAESHLRDQQFFDALVTSSLAGLKLKHLWLFPPKSLQSQIDGILRQTEQDVRESHRLESDGAIYDVDLSPDEHFLAAASQDGTVQVWDIRQRVSKATFPVSAGPVIQVQFTADSQSLITTAEGQPAQQWSLAGEPLQTFDIPGETITRVSVSPEGQWIATDASSGDVYLWSLTGDIQRQFETGSSFVTDINISISGDSRHLLAADGDGTVHLWSLTDETYYPLRHDGIVLAASFSPDQQSVMTASWDHTLRQWDLQGNELKRFPLDGEVMDIDFPSGNTIALAYDDGRVMTWNLDDPNPVEVSHHSDTVYQVQMSTDGQHLISGSGDRTVRFWDLTPSPGSTLKIPENALVLDVRLDQKGGFVIAHHQDDSVKLWTLDGQLIASLDIDGTLRRAVFSPTENLLAIGTAEGGIFLWNLEGQLIRQFQTQSGEIVNLHFSPDGQQLAIAGADQTATFWDLQGNLQQTLDGHTDWVYHIAFSPDGQTLATTSLDETARLWSKTGDLHHELRGHEDWVLASTFSDDGKLLATTSRDRTVKIWEVTTGKQLGQLEGHQGAITDIVFIPNRDYLVTTSEDGTARLWPLKGEALTQYRLYNAAINLVKVSADGQRLVTITDNGTARLWQIESFDTLLTQACQRIRPYLAHAPHIAQRDRHRCDRLAGSP